MFTHISERVGRLGYFKKIVWQGNTHDPDVCLWLSCFSAFHGSGITQNLRNFSIWIIFHALFFEPNTLMTISDESDETKWTWGQIPNQTLVTRQLEQAEIIILLFFDCLIFFLEEPENFVGVPVQASGWGVSSRRRNGYRRAESPWRQLLKAGNVKHTAQHAGSSRDPHFLCIVESLPGGSGLSLLLAGNSVCLRVCVGSPHCPHVLEDECFWRITSVQFGWFPESKIFTFKIYFYTHR